MVGRKIPKNLFALLKSTINKETMLLHLQFLPSFLPFAPWLFPFFSAYAWLCLPHLLLPYIGPFSRESMTAYKENYTLTWNQHQY